MRLFKNGAPASEGAILDLREGSGISLTIADEPNNAAASVTIANSGSSPDFVITTDGTTVTANASTSSYSSISGTDAATVFQAAINALRGIGGLIQFKGGYTFTTGITIYPGIGLVGQGPLTHGIAPAPAVSLITATSAVTGPVITAELDPNISSWPSFPYLADFSIEGNHTPSGQDGILITGANGSLLDIYIEHVLIYDVGGNGINNTSTLSKVWVDRCYLERCQQNGIRHGAGHMSVSKSYIQNNKLAGIDATSSDSLDAAYNKIWANATGGVILWSMTAGWNVAHNNLNNNGDNTHPAVILKSMTSVAKMGVLEGNIFLDTRASASAAQYFVSVTLGAYGLILGNTFSGQKSGNLAINVAANASDSLTIRSNPGFDPVGQVTNPIDTTNNRIGIAGSTSTAVASTDYTVAHVDTYLVVSGGTGTSITIKDPAGNTVQSGLASFAGFLPLGFKVNFGAFSVAPTVSSFAN